MKTITEFSAPTLRHALKAKQELIAAGKTLEELPVALGEALKLEGDKLTLLMNAVELIETEARPSSRHSDLKRIVVFTLSEGEKAPKGTQEKGGQHFSTEFYPPIAGKSSGRGGPQNSSPSGRGHGRGGRRGGKRDERSRGKEQPALENPKSPGERPRRPARGPMQPTAMKSKVPPKIIPRDQMAPTSPVSSVPEMPGEAQTPETHPESS